MDHTLSPLYTQLTALAAKHGAQKLVLFGSRARGDHTERSDIDLAVYGMPPENRPFFWADTEELDTLLKLDIVHITDGLEQKFLENIEKEGVALMDRTLEKRDKLNMALARLEEALGAYRDTPTTVVRDGVISVLNSPQSWPGRPPGNICWTRATRRSTAPKPSCGRLTRMG